MTCTVPVLWADALFPGAAVPELVPAGPAGPDLPKHDPELTLLKAPRTAQCRTLYSGINILGAEIFIPLKFSHGS